MTQPKTIILLLAALIIFAFIGYTLMVYLAFSSVSKGEFVPGSIYDQPALMIIDIQEGSTGIYSTSNNHKSQSSGLISNLNIAIENALSLKIPVIYIKQYHKHWLFNLVSGSNLSKNAPGTELDNRMKIGSPFIFSKYKMDAFSNHELEKFLLEQKINHLYITGLDAAYCIDRTCRAALNRNYKVTVIADVIISENSDLKFNSLKKFREIGIKEIILQDFLDLNKDEQILPDEN